MAMNSRRDFLKAGTAALVCGSTVFGSSRLTAESKHNREYLNLPLGIQLYSVRELLPTDYDGTLKQIAALGYREVEAAGFYNHSANEAKQALQQAGLRCVSGHYSFNDLTERFGSNHCICKRWASTTSFARLLLIRIPHNIKVAILGVKLLYSRWTSGVGMRISSIKSAKRSTLPALNSAITTTRWRSTNKMVYCRTTNSCA